MKVTLFSITCGVALLTACSTSRPAATPVRATLNQDKITNSFEIYLLAEPVDSPSVLTNLSQVRLKSPPLISDSDIIAVYPAHSIMHVRPGVSKRLPGPTPRGTHFMAVVDGEPLFIGVFWSSSSSFTPDTSAIIYVESGPDYLSVGSFNRPAGSPVALPLTPLPTAVSARSDHAETYDALNVVTGWEYTGDPWSDPRIKSCLGKLHKLRSVEPP